MKFNVEVEIGWIGEDSTLDEEVEAQIKASIVRRVEASIVEQIKPQIDESFKDSVQAQTDKILSDYMNKPVVISNGYKTEEYDSALVMIEQKFSSLYDKQLSGKSCEGDALMKKINEKISLEVRNALAKVSTKIDQEARKITQDELKNSSLYTALAKLGQV